MYGEIKDGIYVWDCKVKPIEIPNLANAFEEAINANCKGFLIIGEKNRYGFNGVKEYPLNHDEAYQVLNAVTAITTPVSDIAPQTDEQPTKQSNEPQEQPTGETVESLKKELELVKIGFKNCFDELEAYRNAPETDTTAIQSKAKQYDEVADCIPKWQTNTAKLAEIEFAFRAMSVEHPEAAKYLEFANIEFADKTENEQE